MLPDGVLLDRGFGYETVDLGRIKTDRAASEADRGKASCTLITRHCFGRGAQTQGDLLRG